MSTTVTQSGSGAATVAITVSRGPAGPAGPGGGDVSGPSSATNNNFAAFDSTTGKLIKDSGSSAASFATAAQGTDERVPTAAGLTDKFSTNKASIADNDRVAILDSAASNAPKHSLWSLVKSTLKTYFDTIYAALVHTHVSADITDASGDGEAGKVAKYVTGGNLQCVGQLAIKHADGQTASFRNPGSLSAKRVYDLPDKNGTVAMTSDITGTNSGTNTGDQDLSVLVAKSAYTPAHSILVQQSGTGSPTALSIGTNTLVGRLSGGGSNINDLSTSDVRTLLSINNVDNTSDATKDSATATLTNKTLTNPTVNNYTEGVVSIGNSGATKTIDLTSGTFQTMTMSEACTVTMPTATAGKSFVLKVTTGTGAPTFTGVKWPDDVAPTFPTTASRYYYVSFLADGTQWSGQLSPTYHV
jgi:hypothetical protein